jgi:hypothetical protein
LRQALIDAGASLDAKDSEGQTVLALAQRKPCSMVIRNLIEVGLRKRISGGASATDDLRGEAGLSLLGSGSGRGACGGSEMSGMGGMGGSFDSPQLRRAMPSSATQPREFSGSHGSRNSSSDRGSSSVRCGGGGDGGSGSGDGGDPQVEEFLSALGLEKYTSLFLEHEVGFDTLVTMTEADLKGIGLRLFGPRRKISSAIKRWQNEQPQPQPAAGEGNGAGEDEPGAGEDEVQQLVGELETTFKARVDDEIRYVPPLRHISFADAVAVACQAFLFPSLTPFFPFSLFSHFPSIAS